MHYTNPSRSDSIYDSSGISLGVTTQLRQFDADTVMLGPVPEQFLVRVPPRKVLCGRA